MCWEPRVLRVATRTIVDCTYLVEEGTNDALDSLDTFFGEWRTVGFTRDELGVLAIAIDDFTMLVRRELALGGHGMLDIADVAWHGEATCAFGVEWAVVPC